MAKGWEQVEQATQASQEARAQAEQRGKPQLYTTAVKVSKGGGPVIVRFLEQGNDVNNFARHEYKVPDSNARDGFRRRQFTCLREVHQDCPGCQAGLKRKIRGVYNVIQRSRPVLRKDAEGKALKHNGEYIVDGHSDQVVILDVPSTTAEELRKKDGDYHGLMGLDLKLSDSGSTFQPWSIEPANIVNALTPMSENDLALNAQKHDLDEFMKPPSQQEAANIVRQYGANSGANNAPQQFAPSPAQGNAGAAPAGGNGFLAGAQLPASGGAFGAAAAAAPPPVPAPAPALHPVAAPAPPQPAPVVVPSPAPAPVPAPVAVPPAEPALPAGYPAPAPQQ